MDSYRSTEVPPGHVQVTTMSSNFSPKDSHKIRLINKPISKPAHRRSSKNSPDPRQTKIDSFVKRRNAPLIAPQAAKTNGVADQDVNRTKLRQKTLLECWRPNSKKSSSHQAEIIQKKMSQPTVRDYFATVKTITPDEIVDFNKPTKS